MATLKKLLCFGVFSLVVPVALASQPLGCLIEPFRVADVGSPVTGIIESMQVERGDRVRKGQALATLRADVERAAVGVAYNRAQASGEFNAAVSNADLARQKLARAKYLAEQQFISPQALEQASTESEIAINRLAQAREQRGVLAREHTLAQAQLALRTVRSPTNGVVADRYLSVGERIEEKAVFRIAVIDPLRVEIVLASNLYGTLREGMVMGITPEFAGAGVRKARVVLVDKLIDGASNTFRVRLELPNPGLTLPAGLRCKADLASVTVAGATPVLPLSASVRTLRTVSDSGLSLRMEPVLPRLRDPKP